MFIVKNIVLCATEYSLRQSVTMAAGFVLKKRLKERMQVRQGRTEDIIVFDRDIPGKCRASFVEFVPIFKVFDVKVTTSANQQ